MYFKKITLSFFILAVSFVTLADKPQEKFDQQHFLLTEVLSEHVDNGLVNYKKLKVNQATLNEYLQELATINPVAYKGWTREQKLALWINAYNAFTIKAIIDNYPIEHSWLADPLGNFPDNSIRQIKGVWDKVTWMVMGKKFTLNQMEHEIIRRELLDARIHFVLVCASKGCPYLEKKAFEASDLDARLDQAGVNYIYESRRIRFDRVNKVVHLPQIFKWFEDDFEQGTKYKSLFKDHPSKQAGILSWVYRYANKNDRAFLKKHTLQIAYLYYDWALNEMH